MNNKTTFIRVAKTKNYSVINNDFLRRNDLSWKAKGILTYVLTLPDDWNINLKEVMKHATEGKAAFRSGWKELEDAGYVERYPVRDKQRISHWETIVKERPDMKASSLLSGFQEVENQEVDNQDLDNRNLLSTNNTKYLKEQSTNKNTSAELMNNFEKLWELYPNKQGKKKAFNSYKKAIKKGVTNKDIQDGIVRYKKHLKQNDWLSPAHGATWFNNERWEDKYETIVETDTQSSNYVTDWNDFEKMIEGD